MREALAFALLACACAVRGRAEEPRAAPISPGRGTRTATETATVASTPIPTSTPPSFGDLVSRWAALVPGMHVVATHDGAGEAFEIVRAIDGDLCVRVAFDASEPVTATLADSAGATLATRIDAGAGMLATDGPVCVRRGGAVRANATGTPGAHVRWVAWSAGR